ncbi:dihydroorotase [Flavobacterium psychrophilum]|jgi:dihydroorotase|uniref:Dihydroorotase n=1 Tax=Flavobacterium psychrophilum (strain ATCC 49511 / DSM 21280 / CIP 103535 / JIP02/86) TaxID=402612 RepID=A6GW07_FLAPJ|nr:dihydroorotase [Flavobacterium psychrophilum]AKC23156.1 dihydroorotase [Flavobacterium psychrophilum]EKT2072697.1 dihydroorotase [Flavobacterium psychrophilum]EKT3966473.1 dihydroorotase [Flavobacterium psychrophilum]EKT4492094.1 dihydroorotase [Flavobacterium psychrophilum]EKT4527272.1 dihydroorotase [Flavobacterium psychrophilum]
MKQVLIKNAKIINEGILFEGDVLIENEFIIEIGNNISPKSSDCKIIDAEGNYLIPGMIDDQVHFREPGLTHKGDIASESRAAIAGGITTYIEQPNTVPNAVTQELLEQKYQIAAQSSYANYSFMMGATNDNLEEVLKTNPKNVAGIKIFLGSSTGNMLVDNEAVLEKIFSSTKMLIAVHCEDETTIQNNLEKYKAEYGDDIPMKFHHLIRSEEACYISSSKAVALAQKTGARLHIFHVSTAKETTLFSRIPVEDKQITAEVCIHHLWFTNDDYAKKGTLIKWNPAVKTQADKDELWKALLDGRIDVIATDHAPHTFEEKQNPYTTAPSGGPLVQHALVALFEAFHQGKISIEKIVEKTAHNPAKIFKIDRRGFIKVGYYADLVIVNIGMPWRVNKDNILYKCKWSPFEDYTFKSRITHTFVNGELVFHNAKTKEIHCGKRLEFNR